MKTIHISIIALALLITTACSYAVDRNASMSDAFRVNYNSFNDSEYFGIHITGENLVKDTNDKWAILAGVSGGTLSFDDGPDFDAIGIEIGTKYYITPLSAVALLGGYTWSNGDSVNFETGSITARLKQRFVSANKPVSPYFKLEIAQQFVDAPEDYDAVVLRGMLGCDFMMSQDFAFVFEGGISESDNMDDGNDPEDGWLLSLAMQYYWE